MRQERRMSDGILYKDDSRGVVYATPTFKPLRSLENYLATHRDRIKAMGNRFYLTRGTLTEARALLFGNKSKRYHSK